MLAQARDLRNRAAGGEDFAALARSFSKDDKAAAGGDWGLYDWRSLTPAETEAAAKLDKGGVSEVVETETGAAILKATEKTPAGHQAAGGRPGHDQGHPGGGESPGLGRGAHPAA